VWLAAIGEEVMAKLSKLREIRGELGEEVKDPFFGVSCE